MKNAVRACITLAVGALGVAPSSADWRTACANPQMAASIGGVTPPARQSGQRIQEHGKASVWFDTVEKDAYHLRLSGELVIQLRVAGAAPLDVELLDEWKSTDTWSIRERTLTKTGHTAKSSAIWQKEFLLKPYQPGEYPLSLPRLRYRENLGDWREVTWLPITLKITTQVNEADPRGARDITNIEEPTGPGSSRIWLAWVAGGVVLTFLTAVVLFVRRHRVPSHIAQTPAQRALTDLDQLILQPLSSLPEFDRFHKQLSDVVRRYLEQRLELPVRRQTTAEFLNALAHDSKLTQEQQSLLREFLARSDLAKFAGMDVSATESSQLVGSARRFIEETAALPSAAT